MGICRRLIDDFIRAKPLEAYFTLIFTTRDAEKAKDTLEQLQRHLKSFGTSFVAQRFTKRVHVRFENVELTSLLSVRALCRRLLQSDIPKLDAIILNAGIGGLTGLNWPLAVWQVATDIIQGTTWPAYKLSAVGHLTKPQLPPTEGGRQFPEPRLGEVFCANVFGHYMLAHGLMPLLRSCDPKSPGKIIWISSIEVSRPDFDPDDLQALRSPIAYAHTKRLTDLMALTAVDQPAAAKAVDAYLESGPKHVAAGRTGFSSKPTIHVAHPGICATSFVPLITILRWAMVAAFFISRWIGSPWHPITVYSAANAPVWLALASQEDIKAKETGSLGRHGRAKWGSATDRQGTDLVMKTDVQGWGVDGSGTAVNWWNKGGWGRMRGAKDATKEDVETFVDQGAKVWREMEELRKEWEQRLEDYDEMQKNTLG